MRRRPNHLYILLLSAAVLFHPKAARAQASSDLMPTAMEECEPGGCGTWVFHGKQGTGRWAAGPVGDLTIERFDAGAVSIRRVDTSGPGKGLSGLYSGTRKADHIEGTFTWIWPGGQFPAGTVNWYATIQREAHEPAHAIPVSLSMCEESDGCSTWSFQGKEGHGQWSNGASANLSAEHFGDSAVSIRRVDTTGSRQGLTAFYSGIRKGDHIEGTLIWSWQHNGQYAAGTTTWHATIGPATPETKAAAASEAPGNAIAKVSPPRQSNVPGLPQLTLQKTAENKKDFQEDGCPKNEPSEPVSGAFDMFIKGRRIQLEGSDESTDLEALKWFCRAAKAGSGQSAFEIGELYFTGFALPYGGGHSNSMPPDMTTAFYWYLQAANTGNSSGMVAVATFYRSGSQIKGNTLPMNVEQAMIWANKAANLGDTEAMIGLGLIYQTGMADSVNRVVPDHELANDMERRAAESLLKTQRDCLSVADRMQALTQDRHINRIFAGGAHDHSFFCVATFEPEEQEDSLLGGVLSVMQGQMMATWRYTVYLTDDRISRSVERSSLREEFMRSATDLAIVTAAMKKK
jgi:hypothetical protein